ncbi:MAG: 16S rRNA (cytidine(1402)-2'-O)-methyltransferase [Bacilli bacterium]|nr:16S rRNA (cytidine(1402)-2'-O)-methyltransferase [Bacilli bacterium]MBQ6404612.1 16S rRNA (cytidine(1402)-2'-O)-methyltransferase [Bacilli bacterium]
MIQHSYDDSASLYLIPTSIGNLDDITVRALNTLKQVDVLLCEDTRDTGLLLKKYDIKQTLLSCHEYNEDKIVGKVIDYLEKGKNIGLVTDQGSPIISDPGYIISRAVINAGYNVISLPGATAFVPALSMSGIEPSPFLFYGFLSAKDSKQKGELKSLKDLKYTLIFYESVHRMEKTLKNMLEVLGDRNIAICREISKIHEEVCRDKISNILQFVSQMKGEFVIIVEGNKEKVDYNSLDVVEHVKLYTEDGISEKDAIKLVAKERNVAKSVIYNEYHNRK